eukprot:SAG31_NODE_5859_length_2285_cov_3.783166_2_plen_176_part_00
MCLPWIAQLLLSGAGGFLTIDDFKAVAKFEDARGAGCIASDPARLSVFEPLIWDSMAKMDSAELMKLANFATVRCRFFDTCGHAVRIINNEPHPCVACVQAHRTTMNALTIRLVEEFKTVNEDDQERMVDNNITARTCTQELSIPEWRISPEEMKERLVMVRPKCFVVLIILCCR